MLTLKWNSKAFKQDLPKHFIRHLNSVILIELALHMLKSIRLTLLLQGIDCTNYWVAICVEWKWKYFLAEAKKWNQNLFHWYLFYSTFEKSIVKIALIGKCVFHLTEMCASNWSQAFRFTSRFACKNIAVGISTFDVIQKFNASLVIGTVMPASN